MKGTKLWTQAGSPLIQGRSRMERPLWRDWMLASAASAVIAAAFTGLLMRDALLISPMAIAIVAAVSLLVSGPVVWFVRKLGGRGSWRGGALVAGVLACVTVALYLYMFAPVSGS